MCGVVQNPARRKDFQEQKEAGKYANLPANTVSEIAYLCEEVHIPARACAILLNLANSHLETDERFVSSVPFAIYANGKRYVSEKSVSDEQDVMHLAMAGSVMNFINFELKTLGLKVVMGHCCGIEMHSMAEEGECMDLSHSSNLWRATKLRTLTDADQVTLSNGDFTEMSEEVKVPQGS